MTGTLKRWHCWLMVVRIGVVNLFKTFMIADKIGTSRAIP